MVRAVRSGVLAFFDEHRRALPWRTTDDPYRVWISEVMLQQTRVETVIPYYERWLERFPDLERLAAAPADEVLRAWEGLGYYTRARNLHRAARMVRERHAGTLPRTAAELRTLPGIGGYTAGALASIAFRERAAAVDGNVRRVLSRLVDADLGPGALEKLAARLVPGDRPGDFNQGLMELGAKICGPRRPRCDACPLTAVCRARDAGTQTLRPARRTARAIPGFHLLALVLRAPAGLLFTRTDHGLLAGMWRFPTAAAEGDVGTAARAAIRRLTTAAIGALRAHGTISHRFSHRREHYHVVSARLRRVARIRHGGEWRWVQPQDTQEIALPAAQRRILRLVDTD